MLCGRRARRLRRFTALGALCQSRKPVGDRAAFETFDFDAQEIPSRLIRVGYPPLSVRRDEAGSQAFHQATVKRFEPLQVAGFLRGKPRGFLEFRGQIPADERHQEKRRRGDHERVEVNGVRSGRNGASQERCGGDPSEILEVQERPVGDGARRGREDTPSALEQNGRRHDHGHVKESERTGHAAREVNEKGDGENIENELGAGKKLMVTDDLKNRRAQEGDGEEDRRVHIERCENGFRNISGEAHLEQKRHRQNENRRKEPQDQVRVDFALEGSACLIHGFFPVHRHAGRPAYGPPDGGKPPPLAPSSQDRAGVFERAFQDPRDTTSANWKMGIYMATRSPPMVTPKKTMSMGSKSDVKASTVASTSSS